jgi:hypothetical protein
MENTGLINAKTQKGNIKKEKEHKGHGGRIVLAGLLIALIYWASKDDK